MLTQEILIAKAKTLIANKFHGDIEAAFKEYDKDGDGNLNTKEVETFLEDCGAVSRWSEWLVTKVVFEKFDPNGDGLIAWKEFSAIIAAES